MDTNNNYHDEVTIAGFGGQGIILVGKLLAQTAMQAGIEVTYMPSYGAEIRGGTANSMIIMSSKPIPSPVITYPTSLVVMNKASADKFAPRVEENGLIVYNSSLIDKLPSHNSSIDVLAVNADDIAGEINNPRGANMVMLGAYLIKRNVMTVDQATEALPKVLAKRYHKTLPANIEALRRGAEVASKTG